jgi:hypothetical protein
MGFLSKFKKDKSEKPSSDEVTVADSVEEDSSSDSSGDDFDTIMADIDAVSIDGEEPEIAAVPEEKKVSGKTKAKSGVAIPANVGLILKILAAFFVFFLLAIGAIFAWNWFTRPYPPASRLAGQFFRHLSQAHDRPAWNLLSPDLQKKLKQDDFILVIKGSSFYFRGIDVEKLELNEKNFRIKGNRSYLKGSITYSDNRGEGSFELGFVQVRGQKNKMEPRISSFKVEADSRREIFHRDSYLTLLEFFKTFESGDDARHSFMSFIHEQLRPKMDDYGWIRLHASLAETGFKNYDWSIEDKFLISNVEVEFRGVSHNELGHSLHGRARLFYDDEQRKWSVIGFDFSSSPFPPFQEEGQSGDVSENNAASDDSVKDSAAGAEG